MFKNNNGDLGLSLYGLTDIKSLAIAKKNISDYNNYINSLGNPTKSAHFLNSLNGASDTFKEYAKNIKGTNASLGGYGVHLVGATLKTVALQAASMALNAALTWGVSLAIQGLISLGTYLWKLVPTTEHLKEQLEETAQALASIRSERESLNDELKTTEERIAELEAKGTLSFTEASELTSLKLENAELERKIALLDAEEEREVRKYNRTMNTTREKSENKSRKSLFLTGDYSDSSGNGSTTAVKITDKDYILELADAYNRVTKSANGFIGVRNGIMSAQDIDDEIDKMGTLVSEYEEYLKNMRLLGVNYQDADEDTKKNMDYAYEMIDAYTLAIGKTDILFSQIYNRDKYSEARTTIEELATAGNLTAESIKTLYNQHDNVKQFYDDISKVFGYDTSNIDKQTAAIKKQADAYNALVNGNVDYNKRPLISPEQMKLVYPEFEGEVATTYDMDFGLSSNITGEILYTVKATPILEDGTVLDQSSLDKYIYEELQPIVDNGGSTEDLLAYDKAHKNILINVDVGETKRDSEGLTDLDKKLGEIKNSHWEATKQLNDNSGFENFANELNKVEDAAEGATTATTAFTNLSKTISGMVDKYDALKEAQKELAESGNLSADTLSKLAEKYPELNDDIGEYLFGLISQEELMKRLQGQYDTDYSNYQKTLQSKLNTSTAYFNSLLSTNAEAINNICDAYEVDLEKCKTIEDLKAKIRQAYMTDWMKQYNQYVELSENEARVLLKELSVRNKDGRHDAKIADLKAYLEMLNGINIDFDKIISGANLDKFKPETLTSVNLDEDKHKEKAEAEIAYWKHQHEMGLISEATYYKKLEAIRQDHYANKKDYLDRDRELQEQYHDWEVSQAEDGFEKKIEALQEKYANGKLTYAKLQSELTQLINQTFSKDMDTKNKYLEELSDYLEKAKELKDEVEEKMSQQQQDNFNSETSNLKDRLEMGEITEVTYYEKLKKIRDKYAKLNNKDLKDDIANLDKELHDYEIEKAEISFESKLKVLQENFAKGLYSEKGFKNRVKNLIKSLFTNDKQKQKEFLEQIPDYLDDAKEQKSDVKKQKEEKKINAFETERSNLKYRLEMGKITEKTYYEELRKLRNKYQKSTIKDIKDGVKDINKALHDYSVAVVKETFKTKSEDLISDYAAGKFNYTEFKKKYKALIAYVEKVDKEEAAKLTEEAPEVYKYAKEQRFDAFYNKLKYQLENGFISEKTYYKKLDTLYKTYYGDKTKYLDEYSQYSQEVYDGFKDMYKADFEAKKESLEKQKEEVTKFYDDLIEKKREEHDTEDYKEEQSEKRQTLNDIERQIAELEKDGSEKAKARIAELEEDRKNAEKELEDFEKDHARQEEIERLEKEREAREKEIESEIKEIDKQLGALNTNTATIRDLIIDYAKKKGVTLSFAHALGTRSSPGGFGRINEKGIEMISAPDGNGNYIPMLPNSYVFSAKATEFLWKLATEHSLPQAMYNSIAKSIKTQSSTPSVNIAQPISITTGDIIIQGNADKQTVADIKKQQENTVRMVLQKIKELQK